MSRALLLLLLVTCALRAGEAPSSDLVATIDGDAIHLNELTIGPLVLNDVAARPQLAERVLRFNDCQAACYGGQVRGSIALDLVNNRTHVVAVVEGVDLASLLAGLGSTSDSYTGRVDGRLDVSFPTDDVRKVEGRARVTITDGNLVELSFLANLLVGNVGNVRNQDSAEITAEFHRPVDQGEGRPRDSIVRLSSARITVPKGIVLITGNISFDGDLRLLVVPRIGGGLLSEVWFVGKWFGAALALASSRVARVVVRGTVSRPAVVLNPFANE
jgi:AsmA-like C-terminal region